jgi:hypothetical protein
MRFRGLAVVAAAMAMTAGAAQAAGVVDVDNWGPATGSVDVLSGNPGTIDLYQTFTVGRTGRLDAIELDGVFVMLSGSGTQQLWLYTGGATDSPGTTVRAVKNLVQFGGSTSGPFLFDLSSSDLRFFAGDVLTFRLTLPGCFGICLHRWEADARAGYGGGMLFRQDVGESPTPLDTDLRFRTYVDPEFRPALPAPEPAAWALMILGFGAVGAGLRRRAMA